jgi:cyclic pyranopterin phosphate synthase
MLDDEVMAIARPYPGPRRGHTPGYRRCGMSDLSFTHLDPLGRARMVDVTPKDPTHRRAVARCKVFMKPETTAAIANREVKKGDVLSVARVAGIQAAKRTADTIPLCHPLLVGAVSVNFEIGDDFVAIEVHVDTVDRTGVEMEALHACSVAALTVYDMCKSADRAMVIGDLALWEKTGGRSGVYRRADDVEELGRESGAADSDSSGGGGASE